MSYEHKEGYGALFKNDRKEEDNHPDYKGNIMLGGKVYEIAGWIKTGSKGSFLSISGKLPRQQAEEPERKPAGKPARRDDEIPF